MADCTCLDQNQDPVACDDPSCTYGDCNNPACTSGQSVGSCLDQNQNLISCSDPECTYGDCTATSPTAVAASKTGSAAATGAQVSGGTSLSSLITSLGAIGATTYASTQTPTSTLKVGGLSLAAPTGSSTLIIAALVGVVAIIFLSRKG